MVLGNALTDSKPKKKYTSPKLVEQDHMARVTQKTGGRPDVPNPNWANKNPTGGGQDGFTGGGDESSTGGASGSLFDNPFDD